MLTKQASYGPESKLLEMSDREQIVSDTHVLCDDVSCFRPAKKSHAVCNGTAFSFLSNAIRVKNLFKENLKTLKTTKEATKKEQA